MQQCIAAGPYPEIFYQDGRTVRIETNGTGGAAFRILFRDFLKEAGEHDADIVTGAVIKAVNDSIAAWHRLANGFKETAGKIGSLQSKEMRKKQYRHLADLANLLYKKEKNLYELLKSIST